jgi:cell shape-determining protein MreC
MNRNTLVVIWLALLALSLRPVGPIERAAEWLAVPTRVVSALAAPLGLGRETHADEGGARELAKTARALLQREQAAVLPTEVGLCTGRALIHAEVVDRSAAGEDRLLVRFAPKAPVRAGLPVVLGNNFVGRVLEVGSAGRRLQPGEALIELITHEASRVEARAGAAVLILGGLAAQSGAGAQGRQLAVHTQQGALVPGDAVTVAERLDALAGPAALANGYTIGTLVPRPHGGREGWAVAPAIDYRGGLGQLLLLAPPERASAAALLAHDPLERAGWQNARLALAGTPAFWRATRRLHAGSRRGIVAGSALAAANHYLGRVARVEWVSSEVRLLEDPGSSVLVLADFGGGEAPLHLGLMHTQSFDRSRHELELRWQPSVESLRQVALRRERSVRLFTGSGDRLVPPGLLIGESEVSATRADQVLRVRRAPWLLECLAVEVWQPQAAETDS